MVKKKILIWLLILTMGTIVTACGEKKTSTDSATEGNNVQRSNVEEVDAETGESYYLLADFENYFECTQVKYEATFGKITQISKEKEPDMVTYGNQSAKLEILGTEETFHQRWPQMRIATNSGFFNKTTDFSNVTKITFDIYNALEYETTIWFYVNESVNPRSTMQDRILTNPNYEWCITNPIVLKPGQWNHIEIPAEEMKILKYDADLKPYFAYGKEALKEVGAFDLMFDRGEAHEVQQVYYIDNIRAYLEK